MPLIFLSISRLGNSGRNNRPWAGAVLIRICLNIWQRRRIYWYLSAPMPHALSRCSPVLLKADLESARCALATLMSQVADTQRGTSRRNPLSRRSSPCPDNPPTRPRRRHTPGCGHSSAWGSPRAWPCPGSGTCQCRAAQRRRCASGGCHSPQR